LRSEISLLDGGWQILNFQKPSWVAHPLGLVFKGCGFRGADGRRIQKSSGTLYWYGTGSDAVMETDLSNNMRYNYFFFGKPGNPGSPGTDGTFPDIFILGFP
jgi:hypothetical protein